jgi:hypothetical protein
MNYDIWRSCVYVFTYITIVNKPNPTQKIKWETLIGKTLYSDELLFEKNDEQVLNVDIKNALNFITVIEY